jgi:hypothetical protein
MKKMVITSVMLYAFIIQASEFFAVKAVRLRTLFREEVEADYERANDMKIFRVIHTL